MHIKYVFRMACSHLFFAQRRWDAGRFFLSNPCLFMSRSGISPRLCAPAGDKKKSPKIPIRSILYLYRDRPICIRAEKFEVIFRLIRPFFRPAAALTPDTRHQIAVAFSATHGLDLHPTADYRWGSIPARTHPLRFDR